MNRIFEVMGGQKFFVFLLILAVSIPFFALGKMSEPTFKELLIWASTTFAVTHAGTNIAAIAKGKE